MSQPRQLLPGSTYVLTRRVVARQFALRPDPCVRNAFGYLLAVGAQRYAVDVHGVAVLSNHYHAIVTDPRGELPRFLAWFNRLTAVVVNHYRGRKEALWNSAGPSVVRAEAQEDVEDKLLYVWANAVAAGLVEDPAHWPGLTTTPEDLLHPVGEEFRRPDFFDRDGQMPATARLRLCCPAGHGYGTDQEFVTAQRQRLDERLRDIRTARRAAGGSFLGPRGALRVDWRETAGSETPRPAFNPHVAARDPVVRKLALGRLRDFRAAYHDALRCWRDGTRDVAFPAGTYAMRVYHGARCHAPPVGESARLAA